MCSGLNKLISNNCSHFSRTFVRKRSMSAIETSAVLRPFILRVHPDLFPKHGLDKAKVNEESLMLLSEYIHKLHNNESVKPLKLLFYLRRITSSMETSNSLPDMTTVHLHLRSTSVVDTISTILDACQLPLDYLKSIGINRHEFSKDGRKRPIKCEWSSSNPELWKDLHKYGFEPHLDSEPHARYPREDSINKWLKENQKKAINNMKKMEPLKDEISKLKTFLLSDLGLVDIEWQSGWTMSSFSTALKGLQKVVDKNKSLFDLRGKTIIFSNDLGVSVHGHIVLRQDTVSDSWIKIFRTLSEFDSILEVIPQYERELSDLLNGVKIFPPQQSLVLAVNYLQQLKTLVDSIKVYRKETDVNLKTNVKGLEISIECITGSLMMTESGQIMVPTSCPAFLIFDYINLNAEKAKSCRYEYLKSQISDEAVISLCHSMSKLRYLNRDQSITRKQMVFCCNRLIRMIESGSLNVDLSSLSLRIGQFYTVTAEGEMCIPWNFEIL